MDNPLSNFIAGRSAGAAHHLADRPSHAGDRQHQPEGLWGGRVAPAWRARAADQLHLAVDAATNTIVAATLTTSSEGDAAQVGPLLDQTTGPINAVMADSPYDGAPTY
jgi:hypothetical protein